jgi:hypothetical protein
MIMNRTQKSALLNLVAFLVNLALLGYVVIMIFVLRRVPTGWAGIVWLLVFAAVFGWGALLFRRSQSSAEPAADERDRAIRRNAVAVSFFSTWLLLAGATLIPAYVLGQGGSVPVYVLTFVNISLFLTAMLIYSAAILVQYGREVNDEQ